MSSALFFAVSCWPLKEVVGANGFEPSTSWSRTSGQNHISRCPGVTYWFSGRSLMDKSDKPSPNARENFGESIRKPLDPQPLRLILTNHFLLLYSPFVRILPPFTTNSITFL